MNHTKQSQGGARRKGWKITREVGGLSNGLGLSGVKVPATTRTTNDVL